jgi:hypothetical protein
MGSVRRGSHRRPRLVSQDTSGRSQFAQAVPTKCWPCKSNSVRLGSLPRATKRVGSPSGFRPGFWPQGQFNQSTPLIPREGWRSRTRLRRPLAPRGERKGWRPLLKVGRPLPPLGRAITDCTPRSWSPRRCGRRLRPSSIGYSSLEPRGLLDDGGRLGRWRLFELLGS